MRKEQKQLKNQLTFIFWSNILLSISFILFTFLEKGINERSLTEQDLRWERFAIIFTIIIIPLSLKSFHKQLKKIVDEELPVFLKKVKEYYLYRILLIDIVIIGNLIGYYKVGAMNFLYMAIISTIVFVFCYPTEAIVDPVVKTNVESDNLEDK